MDKIGASPGGSFASHKNIILLGAFLFVVLVSAGVTAYFATQVVGLKKENVDLKGELKTAKTLLGKREKRIKNLNSRLNRLKEVERTQTEIIALNREISNLDGQIVELYSQVNDHLNQAVKKTHDGNEVEANAHIQEANSTIEEINTLIKLSNEKIGKTNKLLIQLKGEKEGEGI